MDVKLQAWRLVILDRHAPFVSARGIGDQVLGLQIRQVAHDDLNLFQAEHLWNEGVTIFLKNPPLLRSCSHAPSHKVFIVSRAYAFQKSLLTANLSRYRAGETSTALFIAKTGAFFSPQHRAAT